MKPSVNKNLQSIADLKQRIAGGGVSFPDRQKSAMRRLLNSPDIVAFGTVQSVAAACDVSQTTIVRAAEASGYSSFSEMKKAFQQHLLASRNGSMGAVGRP